MYIIKSAAIENAKREGGDAHAHTLVVAAHGYFPLFRVVTGRNARSTSTFPDVLRYYFPVSLALAYSCLRCDAAWERENA